MELFDWTPKINLKIGLQKTINWIEENINFFKNEDWNYIHKE